MSAGEQSVAVGLYGRLPPGVRTVVGDGVYDSVKLHRAAATAGVEHVSPSRQGRVGKRRQPERLRVLDLLGTDRGRSLLAGRTAIERTFGRMGNLRCGLKGLPNWVRRLRRVAGWVAGKILIHHAWLSRREPPPSPIS